jgi:hypothetical protein
LTRQQPVEAPREADHLEPAGVHLGQLEGDLVRLRSGVQEDNPPQRLREEPEQALRKLEYGLGKHPRVQVDRFAEGSLEGGHDPRVVVAERRADLTRREVEHLPPVRRLEPGAVRARHDERCKAAPVADEMTLALVWHERSVADLRRARR